MVAGHFGLAAGVKAVERQAPLWALMLATAWLDVLFGPLYAAGIETLDSVPGTSGGYGNVIIHAGYTHSLVGAAVIAAAFGLVGGSLGPAYRSGAGRRGVLALAARPARPPGRHGDPSGEHRWIAPGRLRPVASASGVGRGRAGPHRCRFLPVLASGGEDRACRRGSRQRPGPSPRGAGVRRRCGGPGLGSPGRLRAPARAESPSAPSRLSFRVGRDPARRGETSGRPRAPLPAPGSAR
jgi:hypothetical protein